MAKCIAFQMAEAKDAFDHMVLESVCNYGSHAYGHSLHTWDEGERILCRCKNCGGYVLIQMSEFHSFSGNDSYYSDYFPVESEAEADELNRKYGGFEIESKFEGRYLIRDGSKPHWMN